MQYDENGNPITTTVVTENDDEEFDTTGGHEQEDQDIPEGESPDEKIARLEKQVQKLKTNKVKNIIKHKTNKDENILRIEKLEQDYAQAKKEKLELEVKSIYADAEVDKVQELVSKWLTVKQAMNALYAEDMIKSPATRVIWRQATPSSGTGKTDIPKNIESRPKSTREKRMKKNWY